MFIQDFQIFCTHTLYYTFYTSAGPLALGINASKCSCRLSHIGDEYQWAVFFIFNGGVTVTMQERADELRRQQLVGVSVLDVAKLYY